MGSTGTSLDDLDTMPEPTGDDAHEVNKYIKNIENGGSSGYDQDQPFDAEHTSQPSINIGDIVRDINSTPDRPVSTQQRRRQPQHQQQQQKQQRQEYAKVPTSALRKQTFKDQLIKVLHLPIIIAIAVIAIFTNPINELIGTWIPVAAGSIYSNALSPTALYIRAGIVGVAVTLYRNVITASFPSIAI